MAAAEGVLDAVRNRRRSALRHWIGKLRHAGRRAAWTITDRRLVAEQRRTTLGAAHRHWRGNSVASNRAWWDGYDWSGGGEEWTESVEWKQALIDDVMRRMIPPGSRVLEIGPGAGRWTTVLADHASQLVLVDISETALARCRDTLAGRPAVSHVQGNGCDLAGIAGTEIDAVWSADVFVHIAPTDFANYLSEIARVLRPGGVAVIHHPDGRNGVRIPSRHGWRAPMSRDLVAALAQARGLSITHQLDTWGTRGQFGLGAFGDAITVCQRE